VADAAEAAPRDGRARAWAAQREVEIDEFFIGGYEEGLKGGRQRGKKALIGVATEVRGAGSGRVRLAVLADASAATLSDFAKVTTAHGAIVHTDGLQSYRILAKHGYDHRRRVQQSTEPGEQLLPRAHRAISNLKAWMHGTHRGVSDEHLQAYLDEYVFRHNRRGTPMAAFQTLLGLGAQHEPSTYRMITQRAADPTWSKPDTHLQTSAHLRDRSHNEADGNPTKSQASS
jgi:transposase-like protein